MAKYAFSDLHGNMEVWKKIKARVQPDDELYCLGDIIDRGENGYDICLDMMRRPNMHFIKGNHEMMAIQALPWLIKNEPHMREVDNWFWNGGGKTWDNIEFKLLGFTDNKFNKKVLELIYWFNEMADEISFCNKNNQTIILSHAGFTPNIWADLGWDRNHFWDSWPENHDNEIIIHGHTPVQYLKRSLDIGFIDSRIKADQESAAAIRYAEGHKIDIDCGTIISNRAALINLDTLEITYAE